MQKKILGVYGSVDFSNYTRRTTFENIWKQHKEIEFLSFGGVKRYFGTDKVIPGPVFHKHYTWLPGRLRESDLLSGVEYLLRKNNRKSFFNRFDVVFFSDPNQHHLLKYLQNQTVVYLIRDPNCLFNPQMYEGDKKLIERADIIVCTAILLKDEYIEKYYNIKHPNVYYWPNTVDLEIWDVKKFTDYKPNNKRPVLGIAGNFPSPSDDLKLVDYLTDKHSEMDFHLSGKVKPDAREHPLFEKIINKPNFKLLDFIQFEELPGRIMSWDIGIVIGDKENEIARYINNNKQYQYLAMGKPFVTFDIHRDYDDFGDMVFIAEDYEDYSDKIELALERAKKEDAVEKGVKIAQKHSAEVRAAQFLNILQDYFKKNEK